MNSLSKNLPVVIKCQASTGLKGCTEQLIQQEKTGGSSIALFLPLPGLCAPLPHSHLSSPACHSIWHGTAPHLLTLLLLSPSWAGGRWQISSLRKTTTTKINKVIIVKQSCIAFQISVTLVTFSFRGQTKLGKKPWASSLLPDTAYRCPLANFPLTLPALKGLGLFSSGVRNCEVGAF